MRKLAMSAAAMFAFASLVANLVARPQYNKQFQTVVKENEALSKALGGKSNCNVCHVAAPKVRNDFGKAVEKAIKTKNVKDIEAIKRAFAEAAKAKVPGEFETTFGELIKSGTLPVTKAHPKPK